MKTTTLATVVAVIALTFLVAAATATYANNIMTEQRSNASDGMMAGMSEEQCENMMQSMTTEHHESMMAGMHSSDDHNQMMGGSMMGNGIMYTNGTQQMGSDSCH